jgi:type II secretory pathway predicted ATPase ExeA/septal ring-binding cell division protein DamX
MYLEHFGLKEPPFRITPHTDFFFDGANRGSTLDALIYAITHDEGIVKVSGEVGSGKTMLCRVLMERLPANVIIIYLANPSLSRDDILYAIADELRLAVPENARASVVMRALQQHLITAHGEGRQVVVLIDEAHAMPVETLEEIRLLSNLETNRNKLLQLVLFGQPELNDILARPDMRQLKERITHNFSLAPLVRDDISQYLDFRMRSAGYRGPSVFSPPALKMIAQSSAGLTRRVNILADKALLAAFSAGSHSIGAKEVKAAIRDCDFSAATHDGRAAKASNRPLVALVGIGAVAALAGVVWLSRGEPKASPKTATVAPTAAAVGTTLAVAATPLSTPRAEAAAPINAPIAPTPPSAEPLPTIAAPPVAKPEPAITPVSLARAQAGPLTQERLETGRAWLQQAANDQWFIQLFATDASRPAEVESLLRNLAAGQSDMDAIHVYYSERSGKPRYGVILGNYATQGAALAAIRDLPASLQANKPYPRQVARLR